MIPTRESGMEQLIKHMERVGEGRATPPSDTIEVIEWYRERGGMTSLRHHWPRQLEPKLEVDQDARYDARLEARLIKLEGQVKAAVDIGLENRTILRQLQEAVEQAHQSGLGAIHSLDGGRVQLDSPFVYNMQVLDGEVVAGIDELSVYGVGASEREAVAELQDELWAMFQELDRVPLEEIGPPLTDTLSTLRARIRPNGMDA